MAFQWADNLHTTAFTPRDFQVELLAAAEERNIIVCLGHNSSKEFIALKLILEKSYELRPHNGSKKITIYITNDLDGGESTYNLIFHLTDLHVVNLNTVKPEDVDWEVCFNKHQVFIMNINLCLDALICSYLDLDEVNLIVIEDCHKKYGCAEFEQLFKYVKDCVNKPKILGLAGPLHSAGCQLDQLCFHLELLEDMFGCKAETASDIVTVLRYCKRPQEIVLQCAPPKQCELTAYLHDLISTKKQFLSNHRFDPFEIYSEEFEEELKGIPDPKKEPLEYLEQFLAILNEFGPWCADRAALNLIMQIEKAKIKTPYERHFLLLCMVSTTLVQVRAHCDYVFQKLPNEKERIEAYSSPKVLRMLEVLRLFKPDRKIPLKSVEAEHSQRKINEIESLDFSKLSTEIDNATQRLQDTSKPSEQLQQNLSRILSTDVHEVGEGSVGENNHKSPVKQPYNSRINKNRRGQSQRLPRAFNNYHQSDPDALCGLIFCNSKFIAKILFSLLYEISRNDSNLNFLMVQYTVDRAADPVTETKQAENEHRKQEEVLKRFRMHSCNLLIGTSVLEEGIELPKCNLVIRWNPPTTYRSYVQCKGRARAHQAYHVIMVAPTMKEEQRQIREELTVKSHKHICPPGEKFLKQNNVLEMNGDMRNEVFIVNQTNTSEIVNGLDKIEVEENELIEEVSSNTQIQAISSDSSKNGLQLLLDSYKCYANNESYEFCDSASNARCDGFDIMERETDAMIDQLAQYMQIEKILIRKCNNREPSQQDLNEAEDFTNCIKPYQPIQNTLETSAAVNLSTAILLVNKYCAKLPSDTFTKLTPLWRCAKTYRNGQEFFQYTLRLPINSPLKMDILGLPMVSRTLARRMTALMTCKVLHQSGELDDFLQPIGKEGFRASEPDWENFELEKADEEIVIENLEPRPGTTRRRQYYYKRIASVFSSCRPTVNTHCKLYYIKQILECPIPDEQNTRGRRIYPPEDAIQGFGILTTKHIPKLSAFSIYTRSGEVRVSLELTRTDVMFDEKQLKQINIFLRYTFSNVLRLQKYLMLFDAEATDNSFFVVPTIKSSKYQIDVDWNFLQLIAENCNRMPVDIPDDVRKTQKFDARKFRDAVVMPWYRNQDQPQYFYVAEICDYLSPESSFPGDNYDTFKEYYFKKYNIVIQNCGQPLLDVDHTSARLNFLTPRYVNRKGVALPTSSEETKRAKRENLEQKQILVPELCTIHPFPASLWRAAVCLPCILYRINALLLADEIRKQVAYDIGLGTDSVEDTDFEWPVLDFGWSLADVLKRAKETKPKDVKENKAENLENDNKVAKESVKANKTESSAENTENKTVNDILEEVDKKIKNECFMEIGTWSNEMAENINMGGNLDDDEDWGILPPNVNLCSRDNTNIRYGSPTSWEVSNVKNDATNYYSDSDMSYQSDDDFDNFDDKNGDENGCLKIEFKSDNVAEAIETEEEIQKRQRQLEIINNINANEKSYQINKNIGSGYDCHINKVDLDLVRKLQEHQLDFRKSIDYFKNDIKKSGTLVRYDDYIKPIRKKVLSVTEKRQIGLDRIMKLLPFVEKSSLEKYVRANNCCNKDGSVQLSLDQFYELNRIYFEVNGSEKYFIDGSGSLFDRFNDGNFLEQEDDSNILLLDYNEFFKNRILIREKVNDATEICDAPTNNDDCDTEQFSFDRQPDLNNHPGPSPSIILQALTMSNANDGINLERLETIGDSFLKYAITTYLYCTYENVHEGKLSHLRSRQVSNLNLYRLGRRKMLGESMIATKFEPHDNWLPPCYYVPKDLEKSLIEAKIPACHWDIASLPNIKDLSVDDICHLLKIKAFGESDDENSQDEEDSNGNGEAENDSDDFPCFIPYNLVTQHSIPDKSIADCVEALIGAYLIDCGPRGALLFMAWLGIRVLPYKEDLYVRADENSKRITGSTTPYERGKQQYQTVYGYWAAPKTPLLHYAPNPSETLEFLLDGYSDFEAHIGYFFNDRSYLLQAMTHASYTPNRLTDCYQRLEFLGDAVLDYLITRHLYEDPRQHSPGALTDLRSALVNNTIFASLAVRHGFHKYFRHLSPGLNDVIDRFVRIQHENGHSISEEFYLISEDECDEAEDVEVPKALGDVFESVAGAIFLDSNMSLDTVWKIYSNMMRPEIEQFSNSVPKSPIRELLELEPETAKFGKPEKLADGRRVRVTVDVFGKGTYRGIGRNYRIAKCTAAKCALRQLKKQGLINRKH